MSRPDCEELKERLNELVEEELHGDLPASEREKLLEHAGSCSACAELLRSYRSLLTNLSNLPAVQAPTGFARAIRKRIEEEQVAPSELIQTAVPAPLRKFGAAIMKIAAFLAVAAGAWLITDHFMKKTGPSSDSAPIHLARAPGPESEPGNEREPLENAFVLKKIPALSLRSDEQDQVAQPSLKKAGEFSPESEIPEAKVQTPDRAPGAPGPEGEKLAELREGLSGSVDTYKRGSLQIQLPPQSEEEMERLLAYVNSIAAAPNSVHWEDDLNARKRLIVFETDLARVASLETGLQPFAYGGSPEWGFRVGEELEWVEEKMQLVKRKTVRKELAMAAPLDKVSGEPAEGISAEGKDRALPEEESKLDRSRSRAVDRGGRSSSSRSANPRRGSIAATPVAPPASEKKLEELARAEEEQGLAENAKERPPAKDGLSAVSGEEPASATSRPTPERMNRKSPPKPTSPGKSRPLTMAEKDADFVEEEMPVPEESSREVNQMRKVIRQAADSPERDKSSVLRPAEPSAAMQAEGEPGPAAPQKSDAAPDVVREQLNESIRKLKEKSQGDLLLNAKTLNRRGAIPSGTVRIEILVDLKPK